MSIQIPEPQQNGDKLLVWWLLLSTEDRWFVGAFLFLFATFWLTGASFAPEDVVAIGRMAGLGQRLAALSMGALTFVWNELVRTGYIIDSTQSPNSLWLLLVWIGPVGMGYFIWLLHQETWPWERPLTRMREKWKKRPRWLRRRSKERVKDGVEVWSDWERSMALKALGRKRPEEERDWFFPREPRPVPSGQTAVKNTLLSQSNVAHVNPSAEAETAVKKEPSGKETDQAAKKLMEKPVQLTLPMVDRGEKADVEKEEMMEHSEVGNERRRRPGRPGAGRERRWR